jgi:hypothetical protein
MVKLPLHRRQPLVEHGLDGSEPPPGRLGLVHTTAGFLRPNRGPRGLLARDKRNQLLGIVRDASVPKSQTQRSPPLGGEKNGQRTGLLAE